MFKQKIRGFTLIELLVVIAIIGILSAVVLASLNTARAKGADAAIKSDLANIRSQSAIIYDANNQTYLNDADNDCSTAGSMFLDPVIASAITHAETQSGGTATCYADDGDAAVGTAASSWVISVPLKTAPGVSWCVDSTNVSTSGKTATLTANVASCQ
jgi:prepilin-type N-terminal cleavage/methylation domain-containing protein